MASEVSDPRTDIGCPAEGSHRAVSLGADARRRRVADSAVADSIAQAGDSEAAPPRAVRLTRKVLLSLLVDRFDGVERFEEADVRQGLARAGVIAIDQTVDAANLDRAHAQLVGQFIELAFHRKCHLDHAEAPHGAARRVICEDGRVAHPEVRDAVGHAGMDHATATADHAVGTVGPAIKQIADVERRNTAVLRGPQALMDLHGVALGRRRKDLLAGEDHLDRPAGLEGQQRRGALDGVVHLAAESTAHHRLDDPHPLHGTARDTGKLLVVIVRVLRADQNGQHVVRVYEGDAGWRLQEAMVNGLGLKIVLQDDVRFREADFDVALAMMQVGDDVAVFGIDPDGTLGQRLFRRGDRLQRLVVDLDKQARRLRLLLGLRDDRNDRFPGKAHLVPGQDRRVVRNRTDQEAIVGNFRSSQNALDA